MRALVLRLAVVSLLTSLASNATSQPAPEILIMGGPNHSEFLGCLNCNPYSPNSVLNNVSQYGWANQVGKWNRFGLYANPYGTNSACNSFSTDPPILVDRSGNVYGKLSVNEYLPGSVCGVTGAQNVCNALKVMCSAH